MTEITPTPTSTAPIYSVKLEGFEGPLDLLLHLIQKEEMDIYDIQIAQITDRYLEYVNLMEQLDLDVASEFLVMAATSNPKAFSHNSHQMLNTQSVIKNSSSNNSWNTNSSKRLPKF